MSEVSKSLLLQRMGSPPLMRCDCPRERPRHRAAEQRDELATSTPAMAALREQSLSVPIVFVQVTDPVGQGLVPNLARPGGHITGFINFEFSIGTKWLEALKQIAPRVTRVALIYNPETAPYANLFQQPVEAAAAAFAVMPITVAARSVAELERAVDAFARTPNGGLLVLPDVTNFIHRDQIIASPKFSASGRGRGRAAGGLALCLGAGLSNATDHNCCALPGGRTHRHARAHPRRAYADIARSARDHQECVRCGR
jgi:ABC transporter substrate binding protein